MKKETYGNLEEKIYKSRNKIREIRRLKKKGREKRE